MGEGDHAKQGEGRLAEPEACGGYVSLPPLRCAQLPSPAREELVMAGLLADFDLLLDVASGVEGHTICGLVDAAAWPIQGLFRHFRPEIEARIANYRSRRANVPGATLLAAE